MARAGLGRLIAELRAAPGARDVDEALAQLRVRREGDDAIIESESESESEGVDAMEPASFGVVRIARGIYSSVPTAAGRIELLEMARRAAREEIELHVVVSAEQSHLGRLAIDAPRKVLRAAGVRTAEPGDRFGDERFAHCFFDEEGLLDEIARAGLAVAKRHGFTFTLRARRRQGSSIPPEIADPFPLEVARVTRMVREVDRLRTEGSPQEVVASMRVRGVDAKVRGPVGRARLRSCPAAPTATGASSSRSPSMPEPRARPSCSASTSDAPATSPSPTAKSGRSTSRSRSHRNELRRRSRPPATQP
jgi:hypothetical protein